MSITLLGHFHVSPKPKSLLKSSLLSPTGNLGSKKGPKQPSRISMLRIGPSWLNTIVSLEICALFEKYIELKAFAYSGLRLLLVKLNNKH